MVGHPEEAGPSPRAPEGPPGLGMSPAGPGPEAPVGFRLWVEPAVSRAFRPRGGYSHFLWPALHLSFPGSPVSAQGPG